MAMLRLPTKESGGKANLQQGAVGVGIDMASGITTTAIYGKKATPIDYVPGTRLFLSGIKIPYWNDILHFAIEAQKISGLGFLGADIAIDRENGPIFLELNARPGLQIQVANQSGLKERLTRVEGLKIKNTAHGVRVGKNLFGGEIEESLEEISGKKVIGTTETIKLISQSNKELEVKAKIDTGAFSTSLDSSLAKKLGYGKILERFDALDQSQYEITRGKLADIKKDILQKFGEDSSLLKDIVLIHSASGSTLRPIIELNFVMDNTLVTSRVNVVDRSNLQYPILIGRKDLKKFLIEIK